MTDAKTSSSKENTQYADSFDLLKMTQHKNGVSLSKKVKENEVAFLAKSQPLAELLIGPESILFYWAACFTAPILISLLFLPELVSLMVASSTFIASLAVGIPLGFKLRRIGVKTEKSLRKGFEEWLQENYSVEVDDSTLEYLASFLLREAKSSEAQKEFLDVHNTCFVFRKHSSGEFSVHEKADEIAPISQTAEREARLPFAGQSLELATSIAQTINKLRGRTLSVESNHFIARVKDDLVQVAELQAELTRLNPEATEHASVNSILAALHAEVSSVLEEQIAAIENRLKAQEEYVKERSNPKTVAAKEPWSADDFFGSLKPEIEDSIRRFHERKNARNQNAVTPDEEPDKRVVASNFRDIVNSHSQKQSTSSNQPFRATVKKY